MIRLSNSGVSVRHLAVSLACVMLPSLVSAAGAVSPVEDSPVRSFFLFDQLEYTTTRHTGGNKREDALRFNTTGWVGGDYHRLWLYTEGVKPRSGKLEDVDVQILYGRLVAPFWDLQAGLRHFKPRPGAAGRNYAVLGVQGLAPYRFGVQAASFVSDRGDVSARAEIEYDLLLSQRWILQPRLATNIALQEVREQGVGRGLNDLELGLRLRYEIKREFAPYVGVSWQKLYGGTARFARGRGEDSEAWRLLAGVRFWF